MTRLKPDERHCGLDVLVAHQSRNADAISHHGPFGVETFAQAFADPPPPPV
jgi:hypothetical protein